MEVSQPILFNPSEEDIEAKIQEHLTFWKPIYKKEEVTIGQKITFGLRGEHYPIGYSFAFKKFGYPKIIQAYTKNEGIPIDTCIAEWYFGIRPGHVVTTRHMDKVISDNILFSFWTIQQVDEEGLRSKLKTEAMYVLKNKLDGKSIKEINNELRKRKFPVKGKLQEKKETLKRICLEESVSKIVQEVIEGTNNPINPSILLDFKHKMEKEEKEKTKE